MASTDAPEKRVVEEVGVTTEAVVVATRGIAPVYEREDDTLRLRRFVREAHAPADLAECPRVVDEHGDPLRALIVRSAPLAPGVRVQVRPLALVADLSGAPVLVAAPVADEAPCELDGLRGQLERLLAHEGGYAQTSWTWSDARAAAGYIQEAVARAMRLRAGRRAAPAWGAATEAGTAATAAERQVARLPQRFQDFVREQLDEDERISLFVHRPQDRPRGLFARPVREGLLVLTDRQALWLEDVRPLGQDRLSYGYDAHVMPVERIAAVERARGRRGEPALRLRGEAGGPDLLVELPAAAQRAAEDAQEHLGRFVQRRGPLPRRIYVPRARQALVLPAGWPEVEPVARGLLAQVTAARGEPDIAAFVIPSGEASQPRTLLALYPDELVALPVPDRGASAEAYSLGEVAWIELRRSLLASHLRLHGKSERTWTSSSLVPVLALFRPLRQRLANARER